MRCYVYCVSSPVMQTSKGGRMISLMTVLQVIWGVGGCLYRNKESEMVAPQQQLLCLRCCLNINHRRTNTDYSTGEKNPRENNAANPSPESPSLHCCSAGSHTHQRWRPTPVLHSQGSQQRSTLASVLTSGLLPVSCEFSRREAQNVHPSRCRPACGIWSRS